MRKKKTVVHYHDKIKPEVVIFHFDGLRTNGYLPAHVQRTIHEDKNISWTLS